MAFGRASRLASLRRPTLWRVSMLQGLVLLSAGMVVTLGWPVYAASVWWTGLVTVLAQAFLNWKTLRGFGDPGSAAFLAGATLGLIGKWVIILVGLVLVWRHQPAVSVAASMATVFILNTLAALTAPLLISRSR